jgi:hypothetical protein
MLELVIAIAVVSAFVSGYLARLAVENLYRPRRRRSTWK